MLNEFGSWSYIYELENKWKNVSVVDLNNGKIKSSSLLLFLKKKENEIYSITTESNKKIKVSGDHPILTATGMKNASELKDGEEIVTYPFSGVKHEEPSDKIILTIEDVKKYLEKIGISDRGNAKVQVINRLKELNILPLKYNSPQLPILIKIMGFILGDGVLIFLKNKKGYIHFYGKEEDLISIKNDLKKIGIKTQNIFKRKRAHSILTHYSLVEFDYEKNSLIKKSTGFAALLALLGTPVGRKTNVEYRIPEWLKKAPLWQKRLFLASFFGAELSSPSTLNKYNFYSPQLNMNKNEGLVENAKYFLEDIREMLAEFEVEANLPVFVSGNCYNGKNGNTIGLRMLIKGNPKNILELYKKIGYEYNNKKQKLACIAIDYIELKNRLASSKPVIIKQNGMLLQRRVNSNFISFEEFIEKNAIGESGLVKDKIEKIQKDFYNGYVYDFTVSDNNHNFIADSIVSHNCGMRLIKTNLTVEEIQPKIKEIINALFEAIPTGVGAKGFMKLNNSQFNEIIEQGAKWCVKNGYGWDEDLEKTETYGILEGANHEKISQKARSRGINQLGTLGSGNHYLEVQKVSDIYDEEISKKLGVERNQVLISWHCGSRGFGHQVATDYLKSFDKVMKENNIKIADRELSCAPIQSKEGQDYYSAMKCAGNMAYANRQVILHQVREVFKKIFKKDPEKLGMHAIYDCTHNMAKEHKIKIDGKMKSVLVHLKGATTSLGPENEKLTRPYKSLGSPIILGGSMETGSYLLFGTKKAEESTFFTTAHGAGRTMSRSKAKQLVRGENLQKKMEKEGIIVKSHSMPGLAEESGIAYKDINLIVKSIEQAGISKPTLRLLPLANIKG